MNFSLTKNPNLKQMFRWDRGWGAKVNTFFSYFFFGGGGGGGEGEEGQE